MLVSGMAFLGKLFSFLLNYLLIQLSSDSKESDSPSREAQQDSALLVVVED